ncbi:hypothetical protein B0H13DRAFT_1861189 [Mycena leptocephala]|nr:hypothetical protein B0H13DRAFT_1897642 [Mycena leptocephala]KAJ7927735.1 hypothetical protein B0H13DRAFT_1861189 [Mycena leptocephala]
MNASHFGFLADAKPAKWLAKPTKWLASQNAGRGLVMPPKSTPTPETSHSVRAQATFAGQKGNSHHPSPTSIETTPEYKQRLADFPTIVPHKYSFGARWSDIHRDSNRLYFLHPGLPIFPHRINSTVTPLAIIAVFQELHSEALGYFLHRKMPSERQRLRLAGRWESFVAWLSGSAAADVIITGLLVWTFRTLKTNFVNTTDQKQTLILTNNSAAVMVETSPSPLRAIHVLLDNSWSQMTIGRIYTPSMLANLNNRTLLNMGSLAHWDHKNTFSKVKVAGLFLFAGRSISPPVRSTRSAGVAPTVLDKFIRFTYGASQ